MLMVVSWLHVSLENKIQQTKKVPKMINEWSNRLSDLIKSVGNLAKANQPVAHAFHNLEAATRAGNVLDPKTHELIALAVAVTTRCDGCIAAHAAAAKKVGATKEEVAAALGTAIALNAGAAYVYSARTLDAYDGV
ncbi:carboxymuconolactone decarboxylase family protein [Aeromonas caviae]|nr:MULTISPECIES: carboxymuconolactone decarboxylase family protein [Aeromonas]MCY9824358.1 carboxymuconolactone decarboxylase family protein [Aeromonas media]MDE7527037.1 carboxymuconolactone decarboxylase family protein [Aeromonas salmonicida]MDE7531387.1 carboxymuconolactone decarboxylase family protein [Aeromonas salmonicida]MDF2275812.1 carboxymuconolactone decarboxylase family protein [Aeromonas caviae]MDX7805642.1 carboxymuconolactone decarboxylase family protein [Aeromonas caviae]